MSTTSHTVLLLAALTTALSAGLFYSWSCSVTPGLARLSDAQYLAAMQSMNRAILNPVFFSCFFGALLLLPLSAYIEYRQHTVWAFRFLLGASLVYGIGVFGVTMFGNVPMNERLDAFDLSAATADAMNAHRTSFEARWNRLNNIRSIMGALAMVLVILACLFRNGGHKTIAH